MRISWRDVFVICTSYWTFDISGSLIQALSQWGRLKKFSGPAMSVDLFSPRPRPAFSIAPVTLAHLRSVYEQAGINDLRQRTTDSPHWLGSWNRLHQWIILGWGCVQPWDEAFVFAFKFCLPHYSVTPFLSGSTPPKKNPGYAPASSSWLKKELNWMQYVIAYVIVFRLESRSNIVW